MIEILLPVEGVEAEIEIVYSRSSDKKTIEKILVKPTFYAGDRTSNACYVVSVNDVTQEVMSRKVIRESITGKITLVDRTTPVKPSYIVEAERASQEEV